MNILLLKYQLSMVFSIVLFSCNQMVFAQTIHMPSSQDIITKQQSQQFMPMNTPSGAMTNPTVSGAQKSIDNNQNKTYDIDKQQKENDHRMGLSVPTQEGIKNSQQRWLEGQAPELTPREKMEQEMVMLLQESQQNTSTIKQYNYYESPTYFADLSNYDKAKNLIVEMLESKRVLSIKDAYYFAESAFGNLLLSYEEYNKIITNNVIFIKQWLKENNYNTSDPEALHLGIQKFMSDTLFVIKNQKKQGHLPYYYDYIDASSDNDRRSYFVTKTLASGSGQCHTFPVTYLILAEALGVEASLAYNPVHSFIRYINNSGTVINYETTIDRFLPDPFYLQTLPVMATAQKNSIYINSLSKKQVVASVLFDLAVNFVLEHWLSDKRFIKECMAIATPYFPDQDFINTANNYLRKRLYADELNIQIKEKGITNQGDIERYPDALEAYNNYYGYMEIVSTLGIQGFPESEYLQMLEYYDLKSKLQIAKNIKAKTKKSLFFTR